MHASRDAAREDTAQGRMGKRPGWVGPLHVRHGPSRKEIRAWIWWFCSLPLRAAEMFWFAV